MRDLKVIEPEEAIGWSLKSVLGFANVVPHISGPSTAARAEMERGTAPAGNPPLTPGGVFCPPALLSCVPTARRRKRSPLRE